MPPKSILVVDDETDLADLVAYNLQRAGYEVEIATTGPGALQKISEHAPDLIVLDVMLPGLSGVEVARSIRTNPKTTGLPILMLTAKVSESDAVTGLGAGADDYVTKPFSTKVLLARIEALLRRTAGATGAQTMSLGPVEVDLAVHRVAVAGEEVPLTLTEFRLLAAMMRGRGKTLSRYDLMSSAMGPGVMVTTRTIDVHIASLRKKLGACGGMIRTVRGVGYRMVEEASGEEAPEGAAEGA